MKNKQVTFSEDGDVAYGKVSVFNNTDEIIVAVNNQYHEEVCWMDNIRIETCISTIEGIGADRITPLSSTDVVIENYYVADVSEFKIGGTEKD